MKSREVLPKISQTFISAFGQTNAKENVKRMETEGNFNANETKIFCNILWK